MTRTQQRWLWVVLGVGFALRLGWAIYARGGAPVGWREAGDQYSYYYYARELAEGRGYISYTTGEATAYNPIGYPGLLAGLFFVVLHTPIPDNLYLAAVVLHVVLTSATVWFVFLAGRAIAGVRVGLVSAAIYAVWPGVVFLVPTLLIEPAAIFATMAAVAVAVTHDWSSGLPSRRRLVGLGVVLGGSVLIRPFSLWLLLGLVLAARSTGATWRRSAATAAVPLAVVVLMMVPWTLRNWAAMDAFVPSSTNMGDTLCIDRNLDAMGGFRIADHDGCVDPRLPEAERNQGNTRKAIAFVLRHPDRELLQIARRARLMMREDHFGLIEIQNLGGPDPLTERQLQQLSRVADVVWFVALGASVVGAVVLVRRGARPAVWIVGVTGLSLVVIPLLLWGNSRFHAPFTPFLAIAAACALVGIAERVAPRRAP